MVVSLPLRGAWGVWRGLPQGLEGWVVQTLLRQVALSRGQQQQVLMGREHMYTRMHAHTFSIFYLYFYMCMYQRFVKNKRSKR